MPATKARPSKWQTISISPLTGMLDTRSRPADLPPGAFRWSQNFQTTPEHTLCRRAGFSRAFPGMIYDDQDVLISDPNHPGTGEFYHNHDHHRQNATREPIVFMQEATDQQGKRYLYDGTEERISMLDEATGQWTDLITGQGGFASRWKAASLEGKIVFTNNVDDILIADIGATVPATPITELKVNRNVSAAKVIVEFSGFILLMNVVQDNKRYTSRIVWCDLSDPNRWRLDPVAPDTTLAGFQDLDYGDEILAAMPLLGSLYIYTRRSIWRATVAAQQDQTFSFLRVYNEPKNQKGCLVYENTLVNAGDKHYYASRDAIYFYSPYVAKPEREEEGATDKLWMYKASGVIFSNPLYKMSGVVCGAAVAEFKPAENELWFSWPTGNKIYNDFSLVLSLDNKTGGTIDAGFTSFCNYRQNQIVQGLCSEVQMFLAANGDDFSIKEIGTVFSREFVDMPTDDPTDDLPAQATYTQVGYNSVLRGIIPTGLFDREKIVREVFVDADVVEQDEPCIIKVRIGNSFNLSDPNDVDDVCSVLWHDIESHPLACGDPMGIAEMKSKNIRASDGPDKLTFTSYEQGVFLYFEVTIIGSDGKSPAVGGNACFQRIDFDCTALAK